MTTPLGSTTSVHVRRLGAALVLGAFLSTGLVACGSDPGDTTCGEFKDKSASERRDLIQDAAEDADDDELSDDQKKQIKDADDDVLDSAAEGTLEQCKGEDSDTKLKDL